MINRIEGFDYNRAIMSVFVVIWHVYGASQYFIYSNINNANLSFPTFYFIDIHILLLAVPCFIFMSNYLFALSVININTLLKRLKRICILLIFWTFMITIWQYGYDGLMLLRPESMVSFINIFLTAGHTIYYFFISLILTLLVTYAISKLHSAIQLVGLLFSLVILTSLPILTTTLNIHSLTAFWNPLNFIPYSIAAVLIANNRDILISHKIKFTIAAVVLCVLFSVFEWQCAAGNILLKNQDYAIPLYSRTSLFFGVMAISAITLDPSIKAPGIIKYMSKYSLALYCIHFFIIGPISRFFKSVNIGESVATGLTIIFVILSSYLLTYILNKYVLKSEILF